MTWKLWLNYDDAADDDGDDDDGYDDDGDDDDDDDGYDDAADDDDDDDMSNKHNKLRYRWSKILAKVILSNLHPNIGHLSYVCDITLCQFVLLEFIFTHSCSIDRPNLS